MEFRRAPISRSYTHNWQIRNQPAMNSDCQSQSNLRSTESESSVSKQMTVQTTQVAEINRELEKVSMIGDLSAEMKNWEMSNEIRSKQTEIKLAEANKTIDAHRQTLVGLKVENEHLNQKLEEELKSRETVSLKYTMIFNDYCSLQEEVNQIYSQIATCDKIKEDVEMEQTVMCKTVEDLTVQFENLKLIYQDTCSSLQGKYDQERLQKAELQGELESQRESMQLKIDNLQAEIQDKQEDIRKLSCDLQHAQEQVASLTCQTEGLTTSLGKSKNSNDDLLCQISDSNERISQFENLISSLQENLSAETERLASANVEKEELERQIEGLGATHTTAILELTENLESVNQLIETQMSQMQEILDAKEKVEVELTDLRELQDRVKKLGEVNKELAAQLDSAIEELRQAEAQKEQLAKEHEALKSLKEDNDKLAEERTIATSDRIQELNERCENLGTVWQNTENDRRDLLNDVQKQQQTMTELTEQLDELREALSEKEKQTEESASREESFKQRLEASTKEINALKEKIEDQQNQIGISIEQRVAQETDIQEWQTKQEHMEAKLKAARGLCLKADRLRANLLKSDKKIKKLQTMAAASTAHSRKEKKEKKELLLERDVLKSQLEGLKSEMGSLESSVSALNTKYQNTRNEVILLLKQRTDEKETFEAAVAQLNNDVTFRDDRIEQLQSELSHQIEETDRTKSKYDSQHKELLAAMDTFKKDNNKIVTKKESELVSLRSQVDNFTRENASQLAKKSQEISQLKKQVVCLQQIQEKQKLFAEEVGRFQREAVEMKQKLNDREQELARLKLQVNETRQTPWSPKRRLLSSTPKVAIKKLVSPAITRTATGWTASLQHGAVVRRRERSPRSETSTSECMEIEFRQPLPATRPGANPTLIAGRAPNTPRPSSLSVGSPRADSTLIPHQQQRMSSRVAKILPTVHTVQHSDGRKDLSPACLQSPMGNKPDKRKFFKTPRSERPQMSASEKKNKTEEKISWFDLDDAFLDT